MQGLIEYEEYWEKDKIVQSATGARSVPSLMVQGTQVPDYLKLGGLRLLYGRGSTFFLLSSTLAPSMPALCMTEAMVSSHCVRNKDALMGVNMWRLMKLRAEKPSL